MRYCVLLRQVYPTATRDTYVFWLVWRNLWLRSQPLAKTKHVLKTSDIRLNPKRINEVTPRRESSWWFPVAMVTRISGVRKPRSNYKPVARIPRIICFYGRFEKCLKSGSAILMNREKHRVLSLTDDSHEEEKKAWRPQGDRSTDEVVQVIDDTKFPLFRIYAKLNCRTTRPPDCSTTTIIPLTDTALRNAFINARYALTECNKKKKNKT